MNFHIRLLFFTTISLFLFHIGCGGSEHRGPTNAQYVTQARNALAIAFAPGDGPGGVTRKVGLPAKGLHDVAVTWTSSLPGGINTNGDVTRPTGSSVVVTLTATLKRGEVSDTKPFSLILLSTTAPVITVDAVQANGTLQQAGQAENAPAVGQAVSAVVSKTPTGAAENTSGFQPPIPAKN